MKVTPRSHAEVKHYDNGDKQMRKGSTEAFDQQLGLRKVLFGRVSQFHAVAQMDRLKVM